MNSNYLPFEIVLKTIIAETKNEQYHIYQIIDEKNIDQNNNINEKQYPLISENWPSYFINHLGQLSAIGSDIAPELPPRNKKRSKKITYQKKDIDYFKNKINSTYLSINKKVVKNLQKINNC